MEEIVRPFTVLARVLLRTKGIKFFFELGHFPFMIMNIVISNNRSSTHRSR